MCLNEPIHLSWRGHRLAATRTYKVCHHMLRRFCRADVTVVSGRWLAGGRLSEAAARVVKFRLTTESVCGATMTGDRTRSRESLPWPADSSASCCRPEGEGRWKVTPAQHTSPLSVDVIRQISLPSSYHRPARPPNTRRRLNFAGSS